MALEKLLPQNVEAEAAALGCLEIDPDTYAEVAGQLAASEFYREAHRTIYQAIVDVNEAGQPADFITLCDELNRRGKLEEVGGDSYISSLAKYVPTSANIRYYAAIIKRTAMLRRLIQAAGQIAAVAYNEPEGLDAALEAERLLQAAIGDAALADEVVKVGDVASAFYTKLAALQEARGQGKVTGIPSGLPAQDKMTGGYQRTDLIVVAGRPATGKSAYMLSMAEEQARRGIPVGIFSLEMGEEQLTQRLISMRAGVDLLKLRTGNFPDTAWDDVTRAFGEVSDLPIYIVKTPAITLSHARAVARRMVAKHGIQLFYIDYLQLMEGEHSGDGRGGRDENRQQEIAKISRGLKQLARELDLPVVALAQLSREVERRQDKHPQLSDLRDSGAIEQDADVVCFLYRDELYDPDTERKNIADIEIAKHRNGPTGRFSLYFDAPHTRYRGLDLRYANEATQEARVPVGSGFYGSSDWREEREDD